MGPGVLTALVLLLLGALASAGEFHHRTVITTYLITPERGRVLTAKLVTHAALGAVVTAFGALISFPIVLLMASAADRHVTSTTHLVALSCTLVGTGALASMCGVAVGSILRHQTAAITLILLWTLLLEILFGGFFPPVLPFGSIIAADGLAGTSGPGVLQSLGVLGAWVCALSLLARHHSIRRDVT
jgi:ABC-2 type transport system permease protein